MKETAERPNSFSIGERDPRRVNLERFPYHLSFLVSYRRRCRPDSRRALADVSLLVSGAAHGAHGDAMRAAYCIATSV